MTHLRWPGGSKQRQSNGAGASRGAQVGAANFPRRDGSGLARRVDAESQDAAMAESTRQRPRPKSRLRREAGRPRVAQGEPMSQVSEVPVFVLCGGLGTRLREETELRPKPMVPIGDRPILWHIMRTYGHFGFRRFVLCAGYKAEVIKTYFLHYAALDSDFTVRLATREETFHSPDNLFDWEITVADTGGLTMTGARVAIAARRYLGDAEHFAVTYGDGLTDADLARELSFHLDEGRIGTVLGVNPPTRFGELLTEGHAVVQFEEKPELSETWINGGFFFFRRDFLRYLSEKESCVLERSPLARLAQDRELSIYRHEGFWACMDTQRDRDHLQALWESGKAPWAAGWHGGTRR
jgi:glucose-1-phosphate cytidylyltransferase